MRHYRQHNGTSRTVVSASLSRIVDKTGMLSKPFFQSVLDVEIDHRSNTDTADTVNGSARLPGANGD